MNQAEPPQSLKVILLSGHAHSGSTVLERVLGSVPGAWPVGEGKVLWHKLANGSRCSCGAALRECPQWAGAAQEAFGGWDRLPTRRYYRHQGRLLSLHNTLLLRTRPDAVRRKPAFDAFEARARLYRAIAACNGARVIIDATKDAYYGTALANVPGLEVSVVHLVRDPRSMIATPSRQRRAAKFTMRWLRKHLRAETAWLGHRPPALRVRYEDFCREPAATVRAILAHAGLPADGLAPGPSFPLAPHHVCGGEAGAKAQEGVVVIREAADASALARPKRLLVTAATAPLLWRYGYLSRPPRERANARPRVGSEFPSA